MATGKERESGVSRILSQVELILEDKSGHAFAIYPRR
jgi:hypothetical protein